MQSLQTTAGPRVSVIIPVFNGASFIGEAIASVRAQQYPHLEIIIVDDGSTDATPEVVSTLGADLRYVYQENKGPAAARNRGLSLATGSVIAFLDADDLWTPDKLELELAALRDHPQSHIVMGHISAFKTGTGEFLVVESRQETAFLAHHVASAVIRRSVIQQIGGFDESLRFAEDIDWFLRAREAGVTIRVLPQVTLLYRVHPNNMTRADNTSRFLTQVIRHSILRRRHDGNGVVRTLSSFQFSSDL